MGARISRRSFLWASGAAGSTALVLGGAPAFAHADPAAAEDLDRVRQRWSDRVTGDATRGLTLGDPVVAAAIATRTDLAHQHWHQMRTDSGRDRLWDDLPLEPASNNNHGLTYERLADLARSWATRDSALFHVPALTDDLVSALRYLHDALYNPGTTPSGNWWWWEIGNPRALMDICALLGPALPAADVADYTAAVGHFSPDPNYRGRAPGTGALRETGANRVDKATITILRGILQGDPDVVRLGRDALSDIEGDGLNSVFQYVSSGDGFYTDGSFIQHGTLPYVGTYGVVAMGGITDIVYLLHGSAWAVVDPDVDNVFANVETHYAPFVRDGQMFDTVRGRAVARQREPDHYWGQYLMGALLLGSGVVGSDHARYFRRLTRGWLDRNTFTGFGPAAEIDLLRRAALLVDDAELAGLPQSVGHRVFPNQDRVVHHRPRWSFTVSLSSDRIGRFEAGNEENARGWFLGDGMTYLYTDGDQGHYADQYWPTVDSYRHAGVTLRTTEREELWEGWTGIPMGANSWVGGTVVGGRFGATGMDFTDAEGQLDARKSWFTLDDEVIALGAGITSRDDARVETVVDNRLYRPGTRRRLLGPGGWLLPAGSADVVENPQWLHLDGVGGYVFLQESDVHVLDEERSGAWSDINTGADNAGDDTVQTRRFTTLWLDHGPGPTDGRYAYAVLPTASVGLTQRRARSSDVAVLANTPTVQGVTQQSTGVVLVNFYAAGETAVVSADAPCSVAVMADGEDVLVAVADPSRREDAAPVRVTLSTQAGLVLADPVPEVRLVAADPVTLEVSTAALRGATTEVRLRSA